MTGRATNPVGSKWSLLFACAFAALASGCRNQVAAQSPAPRAVGDVGLGDVVRGLVADSLVGGGRRSGSVYTPGDAASDSLLREAGFAAEPLAGPRQPTCPGSTDKTGAPTGGAVGYIARVHREAESGPNVLRLDVTVSCSFIYHGAARGFGQGGTWELRLVNGRWGIARRLADWIT